MADVTKVAGSDVVDVLLEQHHPDRVFGAPEQVQSEAAARFIEITRAYETLLAFFRD